MKRPFAVIGFSYLFTLVLAFMVVGHAALLVGACCLFLGMFCLLLHHGRGMVTLTAVFLSAATALGGYWFFQTVQVEPVRALAGNTAHIRGKITDFSSNEGQGLRVSQIRVTQCNIPGAPQEFSLKFYSTAAVHAELYDLVECDVEFLPIENTVTFDAVGYNRARGIHVAAREASDLQIERPDNKGILAFFASLQRGLSQSMRSSLDGDAGALGAAMMLGDRSAVSSRLDTYFKASGVIHLLAISGTHIMLLCGILYQLVRRLPIGYAARNLVCVIGAPIYCLLVGFPFSAVRAAIMAVVCFGVRLFDRQADSINSLGLVALLILLFSPGAAMDLSFQLSVTATFAVLFYFAVLRGNIDGFLQKHGFSARFIRWTVNGVLASILVTFFTFPLVAMSYGRVSLIAPATNLLMAPLVLLELAAGFAYSLFSLLPFLSFLLPMAEFFLNLAGACMQGVVHLLASIPYVYPSAANTYLYLWYFGTIGLFGIAFAFRRRQKLYVHAGLLSVCVLCAGILSSSLLMRDAVQVITLDAKNPSNLILVQNGHAVMVGAGSSSSSAYTTASYLKSMGIDTVDLLLLPRENNTSIRAARKLLGQMEVKTVIGSDALYEGYTGAQFYSFDAMNLSLWKDLTITVARDGENSRIDLCIGGKNISVANGNVSYLKEDTVDILVLSNNAKLESYPEYDGERIVVGSGSKGYKQLTSEGEDADGYESFKNGEGMVFCFKNGAEITNRKER